MTISFQCPTCQKPFTLADDMGGKKARCNCGQVFQVPNALSIQPQPSQVQNPLQQPAQQHPVTPVPQQPAPQQPAPPLQQLPQQPAQMLPPSPQHPQSMGVPYTGYQVPPTSYPPQATQPSKNKSKNKKSIWPAITGGLISLGLITGIILYFVLQPDESEGVGANDRAAVSEEQVADEGRRQVEAAAQEKAAEAAAKRSDIVNAINDDVESFNKDEKEGRDFSNGGRKIKTVIAAFHEERNELIYFYEVTGFKEGGEQGIQFFEGQRQAEMANFVKHGKWRRNGIDIVVKYEMEPGKEKQLLFPAIDEDKDEE